jgi:hypothetical protein
MLEARIVTIGAKERGLLWVRRARRHRRRGPTQKERTLRKARETLPFGLSPVSMARLSGILDTAPHWLDTPLGQSEDRNILNKLPFDIRDFRNFIKTP